MRGVLHGGARHTLDVGVTVRPLQELQAQSRSQSQSQSQSQSPTSDPKPREPGDNDRR
jgi:hypothetical protein